MCFLHIFSDERRASSKKKKKESGVQQIIYPPRSSIFPRKFTKRDQKPHTAQHLSSSASSERGRWRSTKNSTKIVEKPICHIWNIIWKNLNKNLNPQEPWKSLGFLLHYLCIHVLLCEFLYPLAQFRKDVEKVFGRKTKWLLRIFIIFYY